MAAGVTASITPAATGSLAYSVVTDTNPGFSGPQAGNTQVDGVLDGSLIRHGTFVSTATLTANTPFTAGSADTGHPWSVAAVEVQKYGGAIATDASSPAVANNNTTTATTAAFTPPLGNKLILALLSIGGNVTGVTNAQVSDSFGLTWTQAVAGNAAGDHYAGIWYAITPASLAVSNAALPGGQVSSSYSFGLSASGGYGGYTWALTTGALPTGLSLSAAGVISGTPSASGVFTFTVTVTDAFSFTATSASLSIVINKTVPAGGSVRAGWTGAAPQYFYGTLEIPVSVQDHDWLIVSCSWEAGEDQGIAYCADDLRNVYQQSAISAANGATRTQVFAVPNARAASTVYVSTSAFVRWLTVSVLDITGLQPGFTIDASNVYSGSGTSLAMSLSTLQPDLVLAAGAFQGAPGTITPAGTGATWTTVYGGVNGSASDGITQAVSWAVTTGAASPAMTYTATSGNFSGAIVAFYSQGGLPANSNPAWPLVKSLAAFGYTPHEPTVPPTYTDLAATNRYLGLRGERGRSFELDEIAAADMTINLDNHDGALSPGGSFGADLITPVMLTYTWQGRVYSLFRGSVQSIPQTYDFQYSLIDEAAADDFSELPQILLPTCMIAEMLYDKPLDLWPMNEQSGATAAGNWSGRSNVTLAPTVTSSGGGTVFTYQFPPFIKTAGQQIAWLSFVNKKQQAQSTATPTNTITTGFGQSNSGIYPDGLAGTTDPAWGNFSVAAAGGNFQGTVLVDANDNTLPLTSTGATYSVWAKMLNVPSNSSSTALLFALTDANGTTGTANYLSLKYDGTNVTAAQTAGSHTFTPANYLFDSGWHLWTVTITTGGTVTVYLDGASLGSFAGSFPAGTPTYLQFGGDSRIAPTSAAGVFAGTMALGGAYDRVVDLERIVTWFQSGSTGFLDELAGTRIQRVLAWARWAAPQAIDAGLSMQQAFSYLTGSYGSSGLSGAIGNFASAGGSAGVDSGAQADVTIQDIANTENAFLAMTSDGTLRLRQRGGSAPVALPMGDMDYPLNLWSTFEQGLGPWTVTSSCTVTQSAGWAYAGKHSALMTVTGTPVSATVKGDSGKVTAGGTAGLSMWVMSPQGCTANLSIDFYTAGNVFISTSSGTAVNCPPMTPVFLSLPAVTVPGTAATGQPYPMIVSSPATGTQLYFDRVRMSPSGFACPYLEDVEIGDDIQYLYNDVAITRNVDQAAYRARNATSRGKYRPRIYTRTIYSSVDDANAVVNVATTLLNAFATPAVRVSRVTVNAAANPELWPFVLGTDVGDTISFTRTPLGGQTVTGTFLVLHIEPETGPDKAQFTYVLAPPGVF